MLPSDRWPDIERCFLAATAHGADLDACLVGADAAVAAEVRALLAVDAAAADFFARPVGLADLAAAVAPVLAPGERVGVWTVDEEVGRGGMGLVYRAHRADGAYEQTVALKVMQARGPGDAAALRLVRERGLLASLRHPHIARLLDGGTTDDGQPYLALEFVDGVPVTDHAAARALPPRARLGLFLDVCAAVAHAHRRLVVHCDLKPSNVLVEVPDDGAPVVKLLDFGIARALGLDREEAGAREVLYTPRYAAPEQVEGGAVGTATDVYALGVLLGDLLRARTGPPDDGPNDAPPRRAGPRGAFGDAPNARGAPVPEPARGAEGPPAPATPVPAAGLPALDADLAAIVGRATERDPEQRYPSVDALADDVRRHLGHWPVRARPRRPAYVAGRFLRRHRWPVGAAAVVAFVLALGAGVIVGQSRRIAHERDVTGNVASLLEGLFLQIDPGGRVTGTTSVRELLDNGAAQAARVPDPETKARLLDVLARVYRALADYDRALPMHREAVRLYTQTRGPRDAETLRAMHHLGYLLDQRGEVDEAERIYRTVLEARRRSGTPTDLVESLSDLSDLYSGRGRTAEARALAVEGLALLDRHPDAGPDGLSGPLARASFLVLVGGLDVAEDRPGHGVAPLREAVALYAQTRGDGHTYTAAARSHLARALAAEGRFAEADRLLAGAVAVQRHAWGETHPWTLATLAARSGVLVRAARARALPGAADSAARVTERLQAAARAAGDTARVTLAGRHRQALDSLAQPPGPAASRRASRPTAPSEARRTPGMGTEGMGRGGARP